MCLFQVHDALCKQQHLCRTNMSLLSMKFGSTEEVLAQRAGTSTADGLTYLAVLLYASFAVSIHLYCSIELASLR